MLFLENSPEELLEVIKNHDPAIEKEEKVLDWLSSDEETRRLYDLREKAIHDEITRITGAKEEGREERIKEVAVNMLSNDIDIITKITGLPIKQIEEIKKDILH